MGVEKRGADRLQGQHSRLLKTLRANRRRHDTSRASMPRLRQTNRQRGLSALAGPGKRHHPHGKKRQHPRHPSLPMPRLPTHRRIHPR